MYIENENINTIRIVRKRWTLWLTHMFEGLSFDSVDKHLKCEDNLFDNLCQNNENMVFKFMIVRSCKYMTFQSVLSV